MIDADALEAAEDVGYGEPDLAPVLNLHGARYGVCSVCLSMLESATEQENGCHPRCEDDAGLVGFWNEDER